MPRSTRTAGRPLATLVATVAAAAVLTGCAQDNVRAPFTPREDLLPLSEHPEIYMHEPMPLRIPRDGLIVIPSDGRQTMRVVAALRNVADYYVDVRYRVLFYDASGSQVTRNAVWRETSFPPRGPRQIEASAISMDASGFRIEIAPL